MDNPWYHTLGLVASIALPLFNIPLMMRMVERKSSADLSLIWVLGVFACIAATLPAAWHSPDVIFKVYQVINIIFFSGVTFLAVFYRRRNRSYTPPPEKRSPDTPS